MALCCFQWLHGGEDCGRRSGKSRRGIIHKNPEKHPRLTRGAETGLSDGGDARTETAETPFGRRGKLCRDFREADEMRVSVSPSIYL